MQLGSLGSTADPVHRVCTCVWRSYTNEQATTRFECCNKCGLHLGCQDFVYQHSTGLCVLLPHVSKDRVSKTPNEHVISGSMQIVAVTRRDGI